MSSAVASDNLTPPPVQSSTGSRRWQMSLGMGGLASLYTPPFNCPSAYPDWWPSQKEKKDRPSRITDEFGNVIVIDPFAQKMEVNSWTPKVQYILDLGPDASSEPVYQGNGKALFFYLRITTPGVDTGVLTWVKILISPYHYLNQRLPVTNPWGWI